MKQIHKRFTTEQVKGVLHQYCQGNLTRKEVQQLMGISTTRFFAVLAEYRQNPDTFSVVYGRLTPRRLPQSTEEAIERELRREKSLVEDKRLPISGSNYSAVRDRLAKAGVSVSLTTVIDRAQDLDCYKRLARPRPMTARSSQRPLAI